MKKPRFAQIVNKVKQTQNEMREDGFVTPDGDRLGGKCQINANVAEEMGGEVFDTSAESKHGKYGHTVAVISPKGTRKGKVVDVTQEDPIVGEIEDVRNPNSITEGLKGIFGIGGWARRK